jgi:hypothetical protein
MTSLVKDETTSIIKVDEVGRRRTPVARREQLLDEFERSGLSGAKFAALTGVKYSTFAAWVLRRRKQSGGAVKAPVKPADPVRWLEALVEPKEPATSAGLVLQLPGGVRLEMTQAGQAGLIVSLIRALEQPC